MKQNVVFGLIVIIAALPIVGIVDYLIDKSGLKEDETLYFKE